ncbi:DNA glycosylase [Meira miltonrushii]|uniref:DNA glycosylase n=1 Tax=Meira miltonrushii TaxID=1280837 RepID=A0A316V8N7_9BASI|nr:DNA glycosylase [Meira miltonrushii]PWN32851.1 DNA glycosylase [Meira miltonrushii]
MTRNAAKEGKSPPLPFRSQKKVVRSTPGGLKQPSMPSLVKREDETNSQISPLFSESFCDSFRFVDTSEAPSRNLRSSIKRGIPLENAHNGKKDDKKRVKPEQATLPDTNWKTAKFLPEVPDHVKDGMDVLMIGSNPGRMSSIKCQHFGHPSNHFYRALFRSGFTSKLFHPSEDFTMLSQKPPFLSIGLTNLAARPTRMAQEVDKTENELGALILTDLIRKHKPRVGVFIGIGVGKAYEQAITKTKRKKEGENEGTFVNVDVPAEVPLVTDKELGMGVGLMLLAIKHVKQEDEESDRPAYTLLFACPSTSGRVTSHQLPEKSECMKRARILAESTLPLEQKQTRSTSTKSVRIELI